MALIIISSSSAALRKEVSESLARKLGYACLSREELVDQATAAGIPVGKLEMSVIKGPAQTERLARLKERYLALSPPAFVNKPGRATWFIMAGGDICFSPMSPISSGSTWSPTRNRKSTARCSSCVSTTRRPKNTSSR